MHVYACERSTKVLSWYVADKFMDWIEKSLLRYWNQQKYVMLSLFFVHLHLSLPQNSPQKSLAHDKVGYGRRPT